MTEGKISVKIRKLQKMLGPLDPKPKEGSTEKSQKTKKILQNESY